MTVFISLLFKRNFGSPIAVTEFPVACALNRVLSGRDVEIHCYWGIRIHVTLKSHTSVSLEVLCPASFLPAMWDVFS